MILPSEPAKRREAHHIHYAGVFAVLRAAPSIQRGICHRYRGMARNDIGARRVVLADGRRHRIARTIMRVLCCMSALCFISALLFIFELCFISAPPGGPKKKTPHGKPGATRRFFGCDGASGCSKARAACRGRRLVCRYAPCHRATARPSPLPLIERPRPKRYTDFKGVGVKPGGAGGGPGGGGGKNVVARRCEGDGVMRY